MKLSRQIEALAAYRASYRELESEYDNLLMRYDTLKDHFAEEKGVVYVPFPNGEGLFKAIFNLFKHRPLETMPVIHSHWIPLMIDGRHSHVCANCFEAFPTCADQFAYCPMCAAKMDLKGEQDDQL